MSTKIIHLALSPRAASIVYRAVQEEKSALLAQDEVDEYRVCDAVLNEIDDQQHTGRTPQAVDAPQDEAEQIAARMAGAAAEAVGAKS